VALYRVLLRCVIDSEERVLEPYDLFGLLGYQWRVDEAISETEQASILVCTLDGDGPIRTDVGLH
jgi:hypothetical protein